VLVGFILIKSLIFEFIRALLIKLGILGRDADSYDRHIQSFGRNQSTILYGDTSEKSAWHRHTPNKFRRLNSGEVLKTYAQWLI
jgi:hypothetical protein